MTDQDEPYGLEDIARLYALDAEHQMGRRPNSLQDLIDSVDDHNQLLLDCLRDVKPGLHSIVVRSMEEGSEIWTEVLNAIFTLAAAELEAEES